MKNYTKLIYKLFIGAMFLAIPLHEALANNDSAVEVTIENSIKDKFAGGWSYTVEGAPEGYTEGFLLIVKDGDTHKVQIQIAGATMQAENVSSKGNDIMFDVMVEGDKVAVTLTVDGSKISGKSVSSQGTFNVSGTKTLSAE